MAKDFHILILLLVANKLALAYDLVLMDGVTKKYSCNHFKLSLLLRPNDLQEDSYCYIEKMNPPGFREAM